MPKWLVGVLSGLAAGLLGAADFDASVRPILAARCVRCHSGEKPAGALDLTSAPTWNRGGIVTAGKPETSRLFEYVSSGRMPAGGPPLPAAEIAVVREWISEGARWGTDIRPPARRVWWAFQAPAKPAVPPAAPGTHPIDAFLQAKLRAKNLTFSPRAAEAELIRRLHFSLTGLPPTPKDLTAGYDETVQRLLASPAYGERWARHWLDAVRFGETDGGEHNFERFHAWRYRDYVIQSLNADKPYDKFVREQLTGDLLAPQDPGMVAATGFLVAGPWDSVSAELNKDALMKKTARMDELDDMVTTTFHTFQALTVNCARCHDHKFDPIPTRNYYELTSVFAGVGFGTREVATPEQKAVYDQATNAPRAAIAARQSELDALEQPVRTRLMREKYTALDARREAEPFRLPLSAFYNHNRFPAVAARHFRLVIRGHSGKLPKIDVLELLPAVGRITAYTGDRAASAQNPILLPIPNPGGAAVTAIRWSADRERGRTDGMIRVYALEASDDGLSWREIASSLNHVSANELELPAVTDAEIAVALGPEAEKRRQSLRTELEKLRAELASMPAPAQVYAAKPHPVEPAHLLERGSVAKAGIEVFPGALEALTHRPASFGLSGNASDADRRRALADWITDPRNPLTARVIVNRVWQYHFGNGIVNTPSDFGLMGDRPSHPELLDWLATGFMENGWSLKWLHRQIVSTRAYQQASSPRADGLAADADNRLLWRMPLRRMDAETLRDTMLAVTGSLNLERGGPSFALQKKGGGGSYIYDPLDNDGPPVWRRAVYRFVVRGGGRIFLDSFDCPDPSVATPRRDVSNTPVQALALLNNPFVLRQAERLAARLIAEAGSDPGAQVERAFLLLYGRKPEPTELRSGVAFLASQPLAAFARVLFNTNEFLYTP